jgi:hypothetical protein
MQDGGPGLPRRKIGWSGRPSAVAAPARLRGPLTSEAPAALHVPALDLPPGRSALRLLRPGRRDDPLQRGLGRPAQRGVPDAHVVPGIASVGPHRREGAGGLVEGRDGAAPPPEAGDLGGRSGDAGAGRGRRGRTARGGRRRARRRLVSGRKELASPRSSRTGSSSSSRRATSSTLPRPRAGSGAFEYRLGATASPSPSTLWRSTSPGTCGSST